MADGMRQTSPRAKAMATADATRSHATTKASLSMPGYVAWLLTAEEARALSATSTTLEMSRGRCAWQR